MPRRVIPILPACEPAPLWAEPRLLGDPARLAPVLAALATSVCDGSGRPVPVQRWLRELRLDDGEARLVVAPRLGHEGASLAFDALRRVLHDTDLYIAAAAA